MKILASAPVTFDITTLVQYGVLGVILVLVLFGYLWAKPSVDRILADKDKAEAQRDALLETYQTSVLPVLTEVQNHMIPGMAKLVESHSNLTKTVEDVQRTVDSILHEVRKTR